MIYDNFGSKLQPISDFLLSHFGIFVISLTVFFLVFFVKHILEGIFLKYASKRKMKETNTWFDMDAYAERKIAYDLRKEEEKIKKQLQAWERKEASRHPKKPVQ